MMVLQFEKPTLWKFIADLKLQHEITIKIIMDANKNEKYLDFDENMLTIVPKRTEYNNRMEYLASNSIM